MKVRITVEENVRYQSEIIIEQPETMSNDDLDEILSEAERSCRRESAKDVAYVLEERFGVKVLEVTTGFPDSPDDSELEIIDVSNVKES